MPVLPNARHELFAQAIAGGAPADKAYAVAGYKPSRSNASVLRTNQNILDRVTEILDGAAERVEVTAANVLNELAKVGFSNIGDYLRVGGDGDPYIDFSDLTPDQTAALQEVTVEDFKDGRGDDARDVRRVKFKLHPKVPALVKLGEHFGLFKDQADPKDADTTLDINPVAPSQDHLEEMGRRYTRPGLRVIEGGSTRVNGKANGAKG